MGRFNWIWRTLRTLSVIGCVGGAADPASALPSGTGDHNVQIGMCAVSRQYDGSIEFGQVMIMSMIDGLMASGGSYWFSGGVVPVAPITETAVANCLGLNAGQVTAFTSKGADAASYIEQTHMGFSFTLTTAAGGLPAGDHEYFIPTNSAPTANAGPDQSSVASGATVTLDGSGSSDPDTGDTLSYAWTQTAGTPVVTLSSTTASGPTFTAPTLGANDTAVNLTFSLIVTDDKAYASSASSADTVSITVIAPSATTSNAPTDLVATAGDGQVSIAFTAPSNNGGAAITDYEYELDDNGTWTSASTAATPVVITGLTNGTAYSIKLRAVNSVGNGAESAAVSVLLGSPASEFAAKEDAIRSVITNDAQRSLNNTLASNTRLTHKARERFLTSRAQMQSDGAGLASRNNIALDVDGIVVATPEQMSTQGVFFAQTGNFGGTKRRLVFGDFDIQRDGDTGSNTATISGKIAWEQMLSEQTMLGYYLGGEVVRSNIRGSFTGTQDKYGVSIGGYFVHALQENLFLDGFASLGAGRNNLEMADDTLDLTSEYTTQTVTLGAAVSGVIEQNGYGILPELSVAYGRTTIGSVGFTGVAYGLTDDTLSLDAGSVSTATIMFRPEFRVSLDGQKPSESLSTVSFAPRVMCERVQVASTTNNCGFGAELGISSSTQDSLTSVTATIVADRVGNSTRSSLQLNLEHNF